MENIIQLLKDNKKPFGLMSEEMQEKAISLGRDHFEYYAMDMEWHESNGPEFSRSLTHRLRPDYADEPEIVEYPIFEFNGRLKYKQNLADGDDFGIDIDMAARNPDFIGFRFGDGKMYPISTVYKFKNKLITYYSIDIDRLDEYEVLHATAVLFRRPKC